MTDAMEAVRQAVKQKAANELVGTHGHLLLGVTMPVVAPTEADGSILDADEAAVCNGDAVRVAAEISEDMRGRAEGRLGIDDPGHPAQRPERFGKGRTGAELTERAEELQSPRRMRRLQPREEQPAKEARKHRDW